MRKGVILLLVIIVVGVLFSTFIHADTKKVFFQIGENVTLDGKNIKFLGFDGLNANVEVDGDLKTVRFHENQSKKTRVSGLYFSILSSSNDGGIVLLNITFPFVCGDGLCDIDNEEDHVGCCTDCECLDSNEVCIKNICAPEVSVGGCVDDSNCNLTNPCSIGTCNKESYPYKCSVFNIESCIDGDNCCPSNCFAEDDTDCEGFDKCSVDEDCDDSDPCTFDSCDGAPKICTNEKTEGCVFAGTCYTYDQIRGNKYCTSSGWFSQKSDGVACVGDHECISKACSRKKCGESPINYGKIIIYVVIGIFCCVLIFLLIISILHHRKK